MKRRSRFALFLLTGFFCSCLLLLSLTSQSRFVHFCDKLFQNEMESNALTMHYTITDPEKYDIQCDSISLGNYSFDVTSQKRSTFFQKLYLKTIAKGQLSTDLQKTYDLLNYALETETQQLHYPLLEEPLTPSIGIHSQLPILLAEYKFENEADVVNYLTLLTCIPEYFDSLITFEKEKIQAGLFMDTETAKELITYCEEFLADSKKHFLIETFSERLSILHFDSEKTTNYIEENLRILQTYVFPSYEQLQQFLIDNQNQGQNADGLYYLPNGTDYYACLIRSEVGCDHTLEEIETLLENALQKDTRILSSLTKQNPKLLEQRNSVFFDTSNPAGLTAYLSKRAAHDFPGTQEVTVQIQNVPSSMEQHLSPAFYLVPTIDNWMENVVYLNNGSLREDLSFFTTLAHETYPGHLYQTVYKNNTHPHPIHRLLYFGGYTEGWGTYAEQFAYRYAPISEDLAIYLSTMRSVTLNLYAHLDLYVHGFGWTEDDCVTYLKKFGITNASSVHHMYQLIKQQPANYLKYYLGYLEICNLKETAISCLGSDFNLKEFHQFILDYGPAPFELLESYLKQWLNGKNQTIGADSLVSGLLYKIIRGILQQTSIGSYIYRSKGEALLTQHD